MKMNSGLGKRVEKEEERERNIRKKTENKMESKIKKSEKKIQIIESSLPINLCNRQKGQAHKQTDRQRSSLIIRKTKRDYFNENNRHRETSGI